MKKLFALLLALAMVLSMAACGNSSPVETTEGKTNETNAPADNTPEETKEPELDYSSYTVRVYTNGNNPESCELLKQMAEEAGFKVSIDDNTVYSGADATVMAAAENKDGDILYGLNDTMWANLIAGKYEGISIAEFEPSWAEQVGEYRYGNKAYGIGLENVILFYRTDEFGTNGESLSFDHWSDMIDCGYTFYRQNKVGGTTNTNVNNSLLYPYVDPSSPAGGISVEGWKTLWKYCTEGQLFTEDKYGFDPINRGDVAVSSYYLSTFYQNIVMNNIGSENPLKGTLEPENWAVVDVADGTYYTCTYMGIIDRERSAEEQAIVEAFLEWFGSADYIIAQGELTGFGYNVNSEVMNYVYPDGLPAIVNIKNMALQKVEGTDMNYAQYVAEHIAEWNNIQTNLGFFWNDENNPPAEPDWDNIDWATIVQSAG